MAVVAKDYKWVGKIRFLDWVGLKSGDSGDPVDLSSDAQLCVQVLGALGTGHVVMQGSNCALPSETDWGAVVDRSGFPVEFTSTDNLKTVDSVPRWLRPFALGDAAMTVDVHIIIREAA